MSLSSAWVIHLLTLSFHHRSFFCQGVAVGTGLTGLDEICKTGQSFHEQVEIYWLYLIDHSGG